MEKVIEGIVNQENSDDLAWVIETKNETYNAGELLEGIDLILRRDNKPILQKGDKILVQVIRAK